jgi:hypothetical protein
MLNIIIEQQGKTNKVLRHKPYVIRIIRIMIGVFFKDSE